MRGDVSRFDSVTVEYRRGKGERAAFVQRPLTEFINVTRYSFLPSGNSFFCRPFNLIEQFCQHRCVRLDCPSKI